MIGPVGPLHTQWVAASSDPRRRSRRCDWLFDYVPPLDIAEVHSVGVRVFIFRIELALPNLYVGAITCPHAKHRPGCSSGPGDLARAFSSPQTLAIELSRLRQPVGFGDRLFGHDDEGRGAGPC